MGGVRACDERGVIVQSSVESLKGCNRRADREIVDKGYICAVGHIRKSARDRFS